MKKGRNVVTQSLQQWFYTVFIRTAALQSKRRCRWSWLLSWDKRIKFLFFLENKLFWWCARFGLCTWYDPSLETKVHTVTWLGKRKNQQRKSRKRNFPNFLFRRPFGLSLAPTICPWFSEDVRGLDTTVNSLLTDTSIRPTPPCVGPGRFLVILL